MAYIIRIPFFSRFPFSVPFVSFALCLLSFFLSLSFCLSVCLSVCLSLSLSCSLSFFSVSLPLSLPLSLSLTWLLFFLFYQGHWAGVHGSYCNGQQAGDAGWGPLSAWSVHHVQEGIQVSKQTMTKEYCSVGMLCKPLMFIYFRSRSLVLWWKTSVWNQSLACTVQ